MTDKQQMHANHGPPKTYALIRLYDNGWSKTLQIFGFFKYNGDEEKGGAGGQKSSHQMTKRHAPAETIAPH